jgi:hypothetical protein
MSAAEEHPLIIKFRTECLSRGAAGIKGIYTYMFYQ